MDGSFRLWNFEINRHTQGWKNVPDHVTIGPRKFFCIPENIQDSVAEEENVKQILTKVK